MEPNLIAPLTQGIDSPGNNPLGDSLDMTSYDPYVSSVEELALAALTSSVGCQSVFVPSGLLDGAGRSGTEAEHTARDEKTAGSLPSAVPTFGQLLSHLAKRLSTH